MSVVWHSEIFPTGHLFGIHLNPGQGLFSISQIADGVSWRERHVRKNPNKKTILNILRWLEFQEMIQRESNEAGTFIAIMNWQMYQENPKENANDHFPVSSPPLYTNVLKRNGKDENITICNDEGLAADLNPVSNGGYTAKVTQSVHTLRSVKKKEEEELLRKKNIKKKKVAKTFPRPEWISEKEWEDLISSRKEKKLSNSHQALTIFTNQLRLAGDRGFSVRECLDEFIPSRWTRFKAEWMRREGPKATTYTQSVRQAHAEMLRRIRIDDGSNENDNTARDHQARIALPGSRP